MALYWGGTKGGSQQVDCGNVTVGDSGNMSLCAWVRLPNNFSGAASVIDRRGGSATLHRFWILCVGDNAGKADFRFIRKHTTTDAVAISTQAFDTDDSTWYFVAGTHVAGAAPKLYVGTQTTDLAEVSYSSQTAPAGSLRTGAQPLSLGRQPTNTSTGFGGAIAVVGLFDTALSIGDLRAMRLGGLRTILSRTDLVHCWAPYLNGTSGTVYDIGARSIIAGTTINGTISGTLTQIENPGLLRGFPAVGPADWRVFPSAAGTPATASPGSGSVTVQGAAPSSSAGAAASPGAGSIAVQGFAPTASAGVTATPGSGSAIVQGQAPDASAGASASPGTGSVAIQGFAPSVSVGGAIAAAPGSGSVSVQGFAPTVSTGASVVAFPGSGSIAVQGFAPSVAAGVTITSGSGVLTVQGFSPSISVGGAANAQPGAGSVAVQGFAPTVSAGVAAAPGVGSVSVTGNAPTTSAAVTIVAGAGAVTVQGYEPTAFVGSQIDHIILAGFRRPGYRAPGGEPSSQAPGGRGRARTVGGGA